MILPKIYSLKTPILGDKYSWRKHTSWYSCIGRDSLPRAMSSVLKHRSYSNRRAWYSSNKYFV